MKQRDKEGSNLQEREDKAQNSLLRVEVKKMNNKLVDLSKVVLYL